MVVVADYLKQQRSHLNVVLSYIYHQQHLNSIYSTQTR